jgi:uncharacterized C2H2 Zn-finger protein
MPIGRREAIKVVTGTDEGLKRCPRTGCVCRRQDSTVILRSSNVVRETKSNQQDKSNIDHPDATNAGYLSIRGGGM